MYTPFTKPFDHQQELFERTRETPHYGLFWEQGTGKSKATIDTLGHLHHEGNVNGAIVVAPNGVQRNWITDELPTHLSPDIPQRSFSYKTGSSGARWHQKEVDRVINADPKTLATLAISYDAWMTDRGKKAVWAMMKERDCMLVLDESARIKTPGIRRTKSIVAGSVHAPYRRILSGTPVTNGPFDVYSQVNFLDKTFWRREIGISTFSAFKAYFGVWEEGWNGKTQRTFDMLVGHQNLDELADALKLIASRVTKEQVLDLPPKLYSKRYFEMTPAQRRVYDEIDKDSAAILDNGDLVTTPLAIVQKLRLQQVLCGYVPVDGEDEPVELIEPDKANPRLKLLEEILEDVPGQTIIWAIYRRDIDMIMELLRKMGRKPVRYDGAVSDDECEAGKVAFQRGEASDFVGNPAKGKEGLTLTQANTVIYYNNSFKYDDRKQSEDRAHRIGQTKSVNYIDLLCPGTRDEDAIDALIKKSETAALILGDTI